MKTGSGLAAAGTIVRMPSVEILRPRAVPLGGLGDLTVRRGLPQRRRPMIGAWCYLDHFGPVEVSGADRTARTSGANGSSAATEDDSNPGPAMVLPPHPHVGMQSLTWLFAGEVEQRDSLGNQVLVRPGEVALLTAGHGASHSEVCTGGDGLLHGVQLWAALPSRSRHCEPALDRHVVTPVRGPGWEARVFAGSAFGARSPVPTSTPLLGAELMLAPGRTLEFAVDPEFEHGLLVDTGRVVVGEDVLGEGDLGYLAPGGHRVTVTCEDEARLLLLGGPPFGERLVMWWNFVLRGHEEVVVARAEWEQPGTRAARFGTVGGQPLPPVEAPPLPGVRLRPRG